MKYLLFILCLSLSLVAQAQEKVDSLSKKQNNSEMSVSISVDNLSRLENEKKEAVQNNKDLQQAYLQLQKQNSSMTSELEKIRREYNALKSNYDAVVKSQELANKKLVNIASNFLYIPYEAYSIQEIAIPAFNAVTDEQLRNKHQVKLALLENYQQDIRDLLAFISVIEKELSNRFAKDLKALDQRYINTDYYHRYNQYDDWKNTYLGKKINYINVKMKSYNGTNKPDFTSIKKELNQCLETISNL
jgi:chromosome segregation ATPase